ncbi:hypothetical protein HZC53_00455 [Candidatus Uhrbacteria bacterium]|nr:hypothetical protein [Candidatus Uhrbacteria bacterium]
MTPYMMRYVDQETNVLFTAMCRLISAMPDVELGQDALGETILVSCHMLCRGLAAIYPEAEVRDGQFMGKYDHSWLTFMDFIIDPYPVAMLGGPVLLHAVNLAPWSRLYSPGDVPAVRYPHFPAACAKVMEAVRETHLHLCRR